MERSTRDAPLIARIGARDQGWRSSGRATTFRSMQRDGTLLTDHTPRVGSYALVRLLGEGSMGQVFEARHVKLDRQVAIKMLRPERANDANLVQRFFQEARTVNRINHPHIVGIHDFVEDLDDAQHPRAYCVMEYLEGATLAQLMKQGPVPLARVYRILDQVAEALCAAHDVGVVHRDLKPDNIIVGTSEDGEDFAKVLDFGVAKLIRPDPDLQAGRTQDGAIIGTPRYMSPEQAASLEIDFRTDVYGMGAILYELLTGHPPFTGQSFGPLMASIITQPAPRPGPFTVGGEPIPSALEDLVMRCLEKDPALRPDSMEDLREELAACARPTKASHRRASTALFATAALLALSAVALLVRPSVEASGAAPIGTVEVAEPVVPTRPKIELTVFPTSGSGSAARAVSGSSDAQSTPSRDVRPSSATPASRVNAARISRDAVLNPFQQ